MYLLFQSVLNQSLFQFVATDISETWISVHVLYPAVPPSLPSRCITCSLREQSWPDMIQSDILPCWGACNIALKVTTGIVAIHNNTVEILSEKDFCPFFFLRCSLKGVKILLLSLQNLYLFFQLIYILWNTSIWFQAFKICATYF